MDPFGSSLTAPECGAPIVSSLRRATASLEGDSGRSLWLDTIVHVANADAGLVVEPPSGVAVHVSIGDEDASGIARAMQGELPLPRGFNAELVHALPARHGQATLVLCTDGRCGRVADPDALLGDVRDLVLMYRSNPDSGGVW